MVEAAPQTIGTLTAALDRSGEYYLSHFSPPVSFERLYDDVISELYPPARVVYDDAAEALVQLVAYRKRDFSGGDRDFAAFSRDNAESIGYTFNKHVRHLGEETMAAAQRTA